LRVWGGILPAFVMIILCSCHGTSHSARCRPSSSAYVLYYENSRSTPCFTEIHLAVSGQAYPGLGPPVFLRRGLSSLNIRVHRLGVRFVPRLIRLNGAEMALPNPNATTEVGRFRMEYPETRFQNLLEKLLRMELPAGAYLVRISAREPANCADDGSDGVENHVVLLRGLPDGFGVPGCELAAKSDE